MNLLLNKLIDDYKEIKKLLLSQGQLSFQVEVDSHFRKTFLISCGSYHEHEVKNIVRDFFKKTTTDERTLSFVLNKGVERQYHTYFVWDKNGKVPNNINNFLGLFGKMFKESVSKEIESSEVIKSKMKDFLELGNLRNLSVHGNFLEFNLEKTFDELALMNNNAVEFILFIKEKLNEELITKGFS